MIKAPPATLNDPFEYISLQDDALDAEAEGFADKFKQYREGAIDSPPLKEGKEPTKFVLRPLADAALEANLRGYAERHGRDRWLLEVGSYSLLEVSNLPGPDGKPMRIQREQDREGYTRITSEQRDYLKGILPELGMVVLTHQSLSPT